MYKRQAIKATKEVDYDLIGFHGHTIYHNSEEKISKQIGLGANLSKLTNKDVVYNFRQNDIKNGGEGAPLSPIYHLALIKSLFNENKVKIPISILNIGGIANITEIEKDFKITSRDIGPGNCLIDKWIRKNSDKFFDENGTLADKGKTDKFIFDQYLDNYYYSKVNSKRSLDTNDFDISFAKGLSLENGTTTITDITSELLSKKIGINDIFNADSSNWDKINPDYVAKNILKIPDSIIRFHSVVSKEVAYEMAKKTKEIFESDFCIAITGNAGPEKGDSCKEIGKVFIAIATMKDIQNFEFIFGNHRERVVNKAVNKALELLLFEIKRH